MLLKQSRNQSTALLSNHLNMFCFFKIQEEVKNGRLNIAMNLLKTSR